MRLIAFALVVMTTFASFGINCADSVKVYFRAGHRQFDPSLGENLRVMDDFIVRVSDAAAAGDIESIVVHGYASPDGRPAFNERLAHNRCVSIADYIVSHAGVSRSLIEERPGGIAWEELRNLVEANPNVPSRLKVLDILDNTPVWIFDSTGKLVDGRKKQLMDLDGGRPYNWMYANLFPLLRNAFAVTLYLRSEAESAPTLPLETTGEVEPEPTAVEVVVEEPALPEIVEVVPMPVVEEPAAEEQRRLHFALKTNMLYDAALLPNLELEWLINDNWSVGVEADVAWWKFSFTKIYRMAVVSPEVRYHIRPRAPWHGMYVGVFGGGGLYQLENGGDGYRGEGGMGGVSFGYMWPIGKHFSLEAAVGAGYMHTRYKVYRSVDDHKLYLRTKTLNYVGPLKLKLSVAWRFDIVTAKKSVKVSSTL